jgi:hypothetical protein
VDAFQKDCVSFCGSVASLASFLSFSDLTHLSIARQDSAKKDLQSFVETFFKEDFNPESGDDDAKPTIIFSSYFEIPSSSKDVNASDTQSGPIYTCCGPFMELDYDESIRQTKLLYEKMYPGDEFLPKAPEPEEIIIGDEDATEGNVNLGALADLVDDEKVAEIKATNAETTNKEAAETQLEPTQQ